MAKKKKVYELYPLATELNKSYLKGYRLSLGQKNRSEETVRSYLKDIYCFVLYLQEIDVLLEDCQLEHFKNYMDTKDCSSQRKVRIVSVINGFFKYLKKKKHIKQNPIKNFDTSLYYLEIKFKK